jgi:hypothetical protein
MKINKTTKAAIDSAMKLATERREETVNRLRKAGGFAAPHFHQGADCPICITNPREMVEGDL